MLIPKKKVVINIYSVATPEYFSLTNDFFIPTASKYFNVKIFTNNNLSGSGGNFLSEGWKEAVRFKLNCIINTIEENNDKIIVWSDSDVVFLDDPIKIMLEYIENFDVCGMSEREADQPNYINGGFLVIRCDKKTSFFWKSILEEVINNDYGLYDQDAMNDLFENYDINVRSLPLSFWCEHRVYCFGEKRPEKIIVYHHNQSGLESKYYNIKNIVDENLKKIKNPKIIM